MCLFKLIYSYFCPFSSQVTRSKILFSFLPAHLPFGDVRAYLFPISLLYSSLPRQNLASHILFAWAVSGYLDSENGLQFFLFSCFVFVFICVYKVSIKLVFLPFNKIYRRCRGGTVFIAQNEPFPLKCLHNTQVY